MADIEKFNEDRGWEFDTYDEFMAAFDRMARSENGILITEQDFMAEADDNEETTRKVYRKLEALVEAGKLKAWDVYMYARYGWCLDKPEAILAYQVGPHGNRWEVNNCSQEANWEEAIMAVNREFGFEASQIRIVGVPYYEATDYQFIRFDCAHMAWLWKNGELYQTCQ